MRFEERGAFGRHCRVNDGLQPGQRGFVGKHLMAEPVAVDPVRPG